MIPWGRAFFVRRAARLLRTARDARGGYGGPVKHCATCGADYDGPLTICPLDRTPLTLRGDALEGAVIASRYTLREKIGEGTFAFVHRASRDLGANAGAAASDVAVKLLRPHAAASPQIRERFLREARAGRVLHHPHIVETLDVGEDRGRAFLVLALCVGRTLAAELARGPLAPPLAITIALHLARALDTAHRAGVVHRDVKPANVFLLEGPAPHAMLLDFGLARVKDELGLTATGALCGTPAYLAPEHIEGGRAGASADLYSLGCVLFEMLTGHHPFEGGSAGAVLDRHVREPAVPPSALAPSVPVELDALVADLLQKSPDRRPPDAATVASRLASLLPGSAFD